MNGDSREAEAVSRDRCGGDRHVDMRAVMGAFATGVTVVTSGGNSRTHDRQRVHVGLARPGDGVGVREAVRRNAQHNSGERDVRGVDPRRRTGRTGALLRQSQPAARRAEFRTVDFRPGQHTGSPIIEGNLGWVECELAAVYEGGDHSIFLGSVLDIGDGDRDRRTGVPTGRFSVLAMDVHGVR